MGLFLVSLLKKKAIWWNCITLIKKSIEIDEWLVHVIPCEFDSIQLIDKAQVYGLYEIVWNSIKFEKNNKSFVLENKLGENVIFNLSQKLAKVDERQNSADLGRSL